MPASPLHRVRSREAMKAAIDSSDDSDVRAREPSVVEEAKRSILYVLFVHVPLLTIVYSYQFITWLLFLPVSVPLKHIFDVEFERIDFKSVPLNRRKQTTAVLAFMSLIPLTAVAYSTALLLLVFPPTTLLMGAYLFWLNYLDKSPRNGQRYPWIRFSNAGKHFVDYFPIRLVNEAPDAYDSEKRYVFGYHPHGIIGIGAMGAFGTDGAGFSTKFPKIKDLRLLTLSQNFKVPFLRELLLWTGVASCSHKACATMLNSGKSIALVVGGAEESLDAAPGTYRLVLGKRRGFVKIAIENDADLVPVVGFGETDTFDSFGSSRGTHLRTFQAWSQKKLGFAVPIFSGRGIFQYQFGFLPHRKPIVVCAGRPVEVSKIVAECKKQGVTDSKEILHVVHSKYIERLKETWDNNKDKVGISRRESLQLSS